MWGIGLADITHQADFNGLNIAVYGGMSQGIAARHAEPVRVY